MRPNKSQSKIIVKAVKNNTSNLRIAFIEAAVKINQTLSKKMTIDQVSSAWYQHLKYSKEVFSNTLGGKKIKNTKNSSKCLVKTTK